MKKIISFLLCISFSSVVVAQDNCSNATPLCANNTIAATTAGATSSPTDPALSCSDHVVNNSVWFTVLAINNGTATITVSHIDNNPGLEMEIYTGACGALTTTGACASGVGPSGTMSATFNTTAGTTYYIMVDGTNGNQEAFNLVATTSNDAIIAKPDANFNTNPSNGCIPLSVLLQNTTTLHGGTNITYQWRIDGGLYISSSGSDTTILLTTLGTHTIDLRVCNAECGCKSISQDVVVQNLFPSISYSASTNCMNAPVDFAGDAVILPDPPHVDPNTAVWLWNFGDPNSGANNTASGQFVTHAFVGPGNSFTVQLIVDGTCGPDTAYTTVNLNPKPVVTAGPDQIICEGNTAILTATIISGAQPIQSYNWVGPGTIGCSNCATTTVDDLPAGGPYLFSLDIVDANGCTADTTVSITVSPKPFVDAGVDQFTCAYQPVTLTATPQSGNPPFTFQWIPPTDLNNDTLQSPTATVNASTSYCVVITDSTGCVSNAACVNIFVYPPPVISPAIAILCSSNPNLIDTFTVSGAGAGSTYSWILSSNYSLITNSNADSSSIEVTFPSGVAGNYSFTVVVTDGVTGCVDTVSTSFSVTNGLNMSITGASQICTGQAAVLTASGANTYAWTANPAYAFGDSTLASQTVSPPVSTVFTVLGTAGNCSQIISHTLIVNPNPLAVIAAIPNFCGCTTVALNGTGSTPGMIYLWTSLGGSIIANPNALNTTSTICSTETFILTVTDPSTGCSTSDTVVANELPNPVAVANVSPNIICAGTPTPVSLVGTGSTTTGGVIYHWSSNNISAVIADTTALVTSTTVSTATIFYFTVTDTLGCDSTASDTVNFYPPPIFSASPAFLCTADPSSQSTLSITGAGAGSTFSWDSIPPCAIPNTASGSSQLFDFSGCGIGVYHFVVTVTDGVTACVTTLSQTVTITSGVALVVSNDTSICEGSSVTLTASGANSYVWSSGDTTSSVTFSNLTAAGSPYQFIVTGTVGSCTARDTIVVTVNPVPITSPINGSISVCENAAGTIYSVTPLSGNYTWSVVGGIIFSGQGTNSIHVNWGTAGVGTVSVFDTSSSGCHGATQTLNVTINPIPVTSPITGADTVCENSTSSYFIFPNAGSTYNWSVSGGTISGSSAGSFISVNWGTAGSGTITVTETNAVGCTGIPVTMNVVINPVPIPLTISGNANLCEGDTMQLYFVTGAPGSIYSWIVTGGTIVSGQGTDSILVNWGASTIGSITVQETNSFGCSGAIASYFITLNIPPVATAAPDSATICQNSSLQIIGSANIGTIHWMTSGTGTFSDTTIASPIYFPGATDTGYVTLTMVLSSSPCSDDTAFVVLYVSPNPVVTLTATSDSICEGSSDSLIATGGGMYVWNPGGDTTSTIVVSPSVTTTYSVSVSNGFGCTITDSITVIVVPLPVTSPIAGTDTVCENDTSVIYSATPASGNYSWTVTGGTIASGQGTDSIFVNWGLAGAGTISVVDTNALGCQGNIQTITVSIFAFPVTPSISGPDSVCENSITSYSVTSTVGSTYNWNVSGGTIIGSSTGSFISVNWGTAGAGQVSVTETNVAGCIGSTQIKNIVINPVPLPPTVSGNTNLCEGDTMQLYYVSGTFGSTYNWSSSSGATIVSGQGTDSVYVNWSVVSSGTIYVTETNSFGCTSDSTSYNVTLNPHPVATIVPDSVSVCQNNSYQITGSVNVGTIHWTTSGNGTFSDTTIASPIYTPGLSDTGYVTLTMVLSSPPCPNDTANIVLYYTLSPVVIITAAHDTICAGDSDSLTVTGGLTYLWNPGGDTTSTIVVNPSSTTTYTVTVSSGVGCVSSDSITITVLPIPVTSAITGADTVCANDSGEVYFVTPVVGNYLWTVAGGTIASGQGTDSVFVNWDSAGTGTITVIDSNSFGCHGVLQTLTVTISPVPVTSPIIGPDSVCENSTTSYSVTSSAGSTYNWIVSGGTIIGSSTGSFISVNWGATGIGSVAVTETNASGCSGAKQNLSVTINPVPSPVAVQGNTILCEGDSVQIYSTNATVGSTFNWSVTGGTLVSGQGTDSIIVNWGTAGIGSVNVEEINSSGCASDTTTLNVTLNSHPVTTALPDSGTICQNGSFPVFGTVNVGSIHWITSGTGTFSNDTIASPIYYPGSVDTGFVTLSLIASSPPCGDDTAKIVVHVALSPVVTISATQNTICFGDSDTLVATGGGNYLWLPDSATTSTIFVHPQTTTTYYVTVTNSFSCSTTDSIIVTVIPPGIPVAGADQILCIGDTAHLSGTYQNAGGLHWSTLGDGTFLPNANLPSVIYVPGISDSTSGGVQIVLITTGACLNLTDTVHLSIYQYPTVFAGNDTILTQGPTSGATIPLNGIIANATGGIWTTSGSGTFSPSDTSLNAVYTPSIQDYDLDSVVLTLTTVGGCLIVSDYLVIDFAAFSIPNVITPYPASPGMNDFFEIKNLPPGSKLKIWDRWGLLVYVSDDYRNDWDAAELKADTFYYILTTNKKEYHGFIKVIREE